MRKRRTVIQNWLILVGIFVLVISISLTFLYFKLRPLIFVAAKSQAETIMLNASSSSLLEILRENDISYNSISRITRDESKNIKNIEIDIAQITLLKNQISSTIPQKIDEKEFYEVAIPLGTLTGFEFASGFGPRIRFPMQLTSTVVVDYKSNFSSEGINQTLHQILITIKLNCNILMLGFSDSFSVSTTEIAAQTVIVGVVPETFTNVVETPTDDIADEIFNFADLN